MVRKKNGAPHVFDDAQRVAFLSMAYRAPTINLEEHEIPTEIIALVPRELCERLRCLPVSTARAALIVAMADPTDQAALEALKDRTGYSIEPVIASESAILAAIARSHAG